MGELLKPLGTCFFIISRNIHGKDISTTQYEQKIASILVNSVCLACYVQENSKSTSKIPQSTEMLPHAYNNR